MKISDRRKLHSSAPQPNEEQYQFIRTSTNVSVLNTAPPSLDDMRKVIKELEAMLKEERARRVEVEQNFRCYQQRTMVREKEFYNIIDECNKNVRAFRSDDGLEATKQIKKAYNEIFQNFQETNSATNSIIEKKYQQNLETMQRRIENIMQVFDEQIKKHKKISNQSLSEIRNEVEVALTLIKSIQNENVSLRISLRDQKYKSKLIEQERGLLLQEMVNKKMAIKQLLSENKLLKQQIGKLKKQPQHRPSTVETRPTRMLSKASENQFNYEISENKKFKTLSSTFNQPEAKQTKVYRFFKDNHETRPTTHYPSTKISKQNSRISSAAGSASTENVHQNFKNSRTLLKNKRFQNYQPSNPNSIKFLPKNNTLQFLQPSDHPFPQDPSQQYMTTLGEHPFCTHQPSLKSSKQNITSEKTIAHLKACLERQRKRVSDLNKIIARVENRNGEVTAAIMQVIDEIRSREGEGRSAAKNQKVFELLMDMKKRLAMCEKPTVQCGWGEIDVEQLLQEIERDDIKQ